MNDRILFMQLIKTNGIFKAQWDKYQSVKQAMQNIERHASLFTNEHIDKVIFAFNKIGKEFVNFLNEASQSNDFCFSTEKGVHCIVSAIETYTFSKGLVSSYLIGLYQLDVNENKMLDLKKLFIKTTFIRNKINAIENVSAFLGASDNGLNEKLNTLYSEKEAILPQIKTLVQCIATETNLRLEYNELSNSLMVDGAHVESEFVIHHLA